jgi:hypothetical protein
MFVDFLSDRPISCENHFTKRPAMKNLHFYNGTDIRYFTRLSAMVLLMHVNAIVRYGQRVAIHDLVQNTSRAA